MMLNKTLFRSLILLSVLFLNACQLFSGLQSDGKTDPNSNALKVSGPWLENKKNLETLTDYQSRGKFAYITERKTTSANFAWYQRSPTEYRLSLTTPFGGRIIELNVTPGMTQLTDDQNKIYINADAQALIYELTGMYIPLHNLQRWLVGHPGDSTDYALNKNYHLTQVTFTDDGLPWQVKYLNYTQVGKYTLPTDIELTQDNLKIKLRISDWDLK